jgi:hypothetical protein
MTTTFISYTMTRGLPWKRLVIPRITRTHRIKRAEKAKCFAQVGNTKIEIPVTISREGGVMLNLEPDQTLDFVAGTCQFDILAFFGDYWLPLAKGTIKVSDLGFITPLEDAQQMEIRFKKGEDYRNSFTWTDDDGSLISITDAYMQAKDANGTTVIDLRWFTAKPSEAAIGALPGNQRGYLAPYAGETLELHISEQNTAPAGTYPFDLFVKVTGVDGDWKFLAGGTVVIEASVAVKPT